MENKIIDQEWVVPPSVPQIRQMNDQDYDVLCEWLAKRKMQSIPKELLPALSLVLEEERPIAFCAIYLDNSINVAFLAWVTTDPEMNSIEGGRAVDLIIKSAENLCKIHGYRILLACTKKSVGKFLYHRDYTVIDPGNWMLLKTL